MFQDKDGDERADEGVPRRRLRGDELQVGEWVRHDQFGLGEVRDIRGSGCEAEAVVDFDKKGSKLLSLKWAPLERFSPDWEVLFAGERVRHDKFGVGEVFKFLGSGREAAVEINFDANGPTVLPLAGLWLDIEILDNPGAGDSDTEAEDATVPGAAKFFRNLWKNMPQVGDRVNLGKFGEGQVCGVSGTGFGVEVMIDFDWAGRKTLLLAFLPLEKLRQGSSGPEDTG